MNIARFSEGRGDWCIKTYVAKKHMEGEMAAGDHKKDHAGLRVAPLFLKANTKSILRTAPEFGMSQNLWLGSAFLEHI
jgi:hypothetical protein